MQRLRLLLQQRDERQKTLAVEAAFVEFGGRRVRRRHHHHPGGEEGRKQAAQNRGVGDVVNLKLVEAQQLRCARHGFGLRDNRIAAAPLAPRVNPGVHVLHEFMEMRPPLARHCRRLEKDIHQHGFARSDRAPQIQAARRMAAAAEAGQAQPARAGIQSRRLAQAVELAGGLFLRRIGPQNARRHQRRPPRLDAPRHGPRPRPRSCPDYNLRAAIRCLSRAICRAGFNPFGQAFVQFMIVWQR